MPCSSASLPDWRDGGQYAHLLRVDRPILAWEWLRRMDGYRSDWETAGSGEVDRERLAARWGLCRLEDPDLPATHARPLWRRQSCRWVLQAEAEAGGAAEDRFDLARAGADATLYRGSDAAEHLLLSDGARQIRIDIVAGTLAAGPALLRYRLAGFGGAAEPLLVLRRFLFFWSAGRFSRTQHPPDARASRWVAMLRAGDALRAGATQREIAEELLGTAARAARWRIAAPSLRSSAQRLVRGARAMASGGYATLLAR